MVHLSILMANHFMISRLYSCSCAHRPSPWSLLPVKSGGGGSLRPGEKRPGAARNCARSPASTQAPPSGAGGKCSCVDGALRTWAGEGEESLCFPKWGSWCCGLWQFGGCWTEEPRETLQGFLSHSEGHLVWILSIPKLTLGVGSSNLLNVDSHIVS